MTSEQLENEPRPIGRIAAWISRQVERGLAETELSLPQYRLLGLLEEGNSLPSSLADKLDVRRPSITAVVDGLVARGLVLRTPAEDDRRNVSHAITEEGRALLRLADEGINRRLESIAGCLSTQQETDSALKSLDLWGEALICWRQQMKVGAR